MTLARGDQTVSTVTDRDGHYVFPPLAAGNWTATVEIFGFETIKKDVDYGASNGPVNFELTLKTSPILQRLQQFAAARGALPGGAAGGMRNAGNAQQIDQQLQNELNSQQQSAAAPPGASENTNESFLVSGSLSPGMTQGSQADSGPDVRFLGPGGFGSGLEGPANAPGFGGPGGGGGAFGGPGGFGGGGFGPGPGGFGGAGPGGFGARGQQRLGQTAGAVFGNGRRRNQQIHGQASFTLTNSAVNAKPFSINGLDIPQAAYAQSRFSLIVGGPLMLGKLVKDPKTQFFVTYFGTRSRTPQLFTETVPTLGERNGDFSQATQSLGASAQNQPVIIYDPTTHQPFAGNLIPAPRLDATAQKLLRYYPAPNEPGNANNYQFETAQANNSDNLGLRIQRNITSVDRLALNFQYQDRNGAIAQPFGYSDSTSGYGVNANLQWTRNLSPNTISNAQVRFNRNYTRTTPFFSLGPNIAAELQIQGTSNNPLDYGPPTLNFNNFGSLSDSAPTLRRNQSQGASESISMLKGVHVVSLGMGYTRAGINSRTDPNARGTFNFTGLATSSFNANGQPNAGTGYDLADFLLDLPQSSSIQYSGFSDYFRQNQINAYAQDEWKARPNLTLVLGVRYDYFSPFWEKYGRLANLDIAPGFTRVAPVTPSQAGPYTGVFPNGLINPDRNNFSPRLG
ncbi:MAG: TonB-dependent receptor, partial [Acidobacteriaceae bacterium]|nr:TonB-dependent receptor [Acidobacteriaceae bacterium]